MPILLIIGYVWPESRSSAAGLRDEALVRLFRQRNWRVVYVSASRESAESERLAESGIEVRPVATNDSDFDRFVAELRPDFVLFDRFVVEEQFGARVRAAWPLAVRILDTQDLHFVRKARMRALARGASMPELTRFDRALEADAGDDLPRELSAIYRSDLTLVISDFEHRLLVERFGVPASLLLHLPFSYPEVSPEAARGPGFDERRGFGVIGSFRHPPNRDGLLWLQRELWPRIRRRLPAAELAIYGAYPPREAWALGDPTAGIRVVGWARDQFAALASHRVNFAPLRFGAGIKGKISDGWRVGTPAVSTSIGAEGMRLAGSEWGGVVADDPEAFAEAAVRLHEDEHAWDAASRRGREHVEALFSDARCAHLPARLLELRASLEARRADNFTGSMLWHHLHRSTEFFSRWIEAKNAGRGLSPSEGSPG